MIYLIWLTVELQFQTERMRVLFLRICPYWLAWPGFTVSCRIPISDREAEGPLFEDSPLLAGLAWPGQPSRDLKKYPPSSKHDLPHMVNCRIAISDREVAGHLFGDLPLLTGLAWPGLACPDLKKYHPSSKHDLLIWLSLRIRTTCMSTTNNDKHRFIKRNTC